VEEVIGRLRDALGEADDRLATAKVRLSKHDEFIRAAKAAKFAKRSEPARILEVVELLVMALEEAESPLAKLLALRADVLAITKRCRGLLNEYERSEEAKSEYHVSVSNKPAKERRDLESHARTTERAARERLSKTELGADDVCAGFPNHEARCVWPLRLRLGFEDVEAGFDVLRTLLAHAELDGKSGKLRQGLFEEAAFHLRGDAKTPMPWRRCAALLIGRSGQPGTVRKAATRFASHHHAEELALRRAREAVMRLETRVHHAPPAARRKLAAFATELADEEQWLATFRKSKGAE
jgi:hypothetical protein